MSDPEHALAIRLENVGKMYKLFASRTDNLLDALGLGQALPWHRVSFREYWALRGISLELPAGRRIGVIGRNGAGKSTLLKLITQNLSPSEGRLEVNGSVQALLEAGAGFHPDFTGYENIHAALTYQGLTQREIGRATADIAEFTELAEFLGQPFKTYSSGMQARLAFAVATTVQPDILIIDEMLSAGDAYFLAKSSERMRTLVRDSGATVLLASHSLDHVTLFCEEALWLDRGHIVKRGSALEVVKAYQQHMRVLEERRLRAKNRKRTAGRSTGELDTYSDTLRVTFTVSGEDAVCEVDQIRLRRGAQTEEEVLVGEAQDADSSHASFVVLEDSDWSPPQGTDRGLSRALASRGNGGARGSAAFNLVTLFEDEPYVVEVRYRGRGDALTAELFHGDELRARQQLELPVPDWTVAEISLPSVAPEPSERPTVSRWPGEQSLIIDQVMLLNALGAEQAVVEVGERLTVDMHVVARASATFHVIPVVVLYRADGIAVSSHVAEPRELELSEGETFRVQLQYPSINLGDGRYVFSVALYRRLDLDASDPYDLIDRSYEFEVVGNPAFVSGIFQHPAEWVVD
jgi:lipopolysaccharide transport system ATP-binding protein